LASERTRAGYRCSARAIAIGGLPASSSTEEEKNERLLSGTDLTIVKTCAHRLQSHKGSPQPPWLALPSVGRDACWEAIAKRAHGGRAVDSGRAAGLDSIPHQRNGGWNRGADGGVARDHGPRRDRWAETEGNVAPMGATLPNNPPQSRGPARQCLRGGRCAAAGRQAKGRRRSSSRLEFRGTDTDPRWWGKAGSTRRPRGTTKGLSLRPLRHPSAYIYP